MKLNKTNRDNRVVFPIIQWKSAHLWEVHASRNIGSNIHGAQLHLNCTEYHLNWDATEFHLGLFLVTMIVTFLANNFQHTQ